MNKFISLTLSAAALAGAASLVSQPALAQYQQRYEQNGYVWEPGHWESRRGQQVWVEGRWLEADPRYGNSERRGFDERRDFDGRRRERAAREAEEARIREAEVARIRAAEAAREAEAARIRAAEAARVRQAEAGRNRSASRGAPPTPLPPVTANPQPGDWAMTRDGDTGGVMWVNSRTGQVTYVDPNAPR